MRAELGAVWRSGLRALCAREGPSRGVSRGLDAAWSAAAVGNRDCPDSGAVCAV